MNREFVRDWKRSTYGLFHRAVVMYTGKLRENFMLVRSLPEVVKFVDCPGALWINLIRWEEREWMFESRITVRGKCVTTELTAQGCDV